ncbi:glycosyltransferase family 2 protein [Marinicella rhabdoformis]|uniref:glycosyltransferase family 2 protein n=1 Tax=Marinicella rhabdoformis TaxID=2580566 RepID=UPI0012AED334|nr:glycosyltransferase family 2 protein [Marinicella rhabdoformis]
MKTLIVIPAFNEADNLQKLLPQITQLRGLDILIVDDFSSDGTALKAKDMGVTCLSLPDQLGAWGATQTGIRYALSNGYDQVVTMDADGQHLPEEIATLLNSKSQDNNVIIGTFPKRLSRLKKMAWGFFKALTLIKIQDLTSGFRLYDKQALTLLSGERASLLDYQDVGVLLLLLRSGLTISEVPVKMYDRQDGKSRVFSSWLVVMKYMIQTTTLCIANFGVKKTK